jgi:hypothetical protein
MNGKSIRLMQRRQGATIKSWRALRVGVRNHIRYKAETIEMKFKSKKLFIIASALSLALFSVNSQQMKSQQIQIN